MTADPQQLASDEWERAYDEAVQWRDWQTCEILLDEREQSEWYVPEGEGGGRP